MNVFQVGRTYFTRSACDHECVFEFEILGRTQKTVTISSHGKTVSRRVHFADGVEAFMPFGRYSMAPVITADREV